VYIRTTTALNSFRISSINIDECVKSDLVKRSKSIRIICYLPEPKRVNILDSNSSSLPVWRTFFFILYVHWMLLSLRPGIRVTRRVCQNWCITSTVETNCPASVIKKMSRVNTHPVGENSTKLVTLIWCFFPSGSQPGTLFNANNDSKSDGFLNASVHIWITHKPALKQGCQMLYLRTKNLSFGILLKAILELNIWVYFMSISYF
jgi:hypothetical protein